MRTCWSCETRLYMMRRIKGEFGACPPSNLPREFCSALAAEMTASFDGFSTSTGAIATQYRWAVTRQTAVDQRFVATWFLCKAAAYEVGLISTEALPRMLEVA